MQAAVRVPVTPSSGAPETPRGRRCLVFQAQAQAPEKGTTVEVGLGLCPAASDSRGAQCFPRLPLRPALCPSRPAGPAQSLPSGHSRNAVSLLGQWL